MDIGSYDFLYHCHLLGAYYVTPGILQGKAVSLKKMKSTGFCINLIPLGSFGDIFVYAGAQIPFIAFVGPTQRSS